MMDPVILERLRVKNAKTAERLGSYSREQMKLDARSPSMTGIDQMVYELTTEVLASKKVTDRRTFHFKQPATWWQHWKQDCAPQWFRKRWPVRYSTEKIVVDFTSYDTYPRADITLPPGEFSYPVHRDVMWSQGGGYFLDSGVSREREYVPRAMLAYYLVDEVMPEFIPFPLAFTEDEPGNPDPRVVASAVINALERFGINPDQLVTQGAIDHRRKA